MTVAVVDSGVAEDNPHLDGALVPGTDLVNKKEKGSGTEDISGQGTAIAGAIGARSAPDSGLVGLAGEASIMPVRVFTNTSDEAVKAGNGPQPDRTAEGIRWAADKGAKIIVVPQALKEDSPALKEATEHATDSGALVIANAGDRQQSEKQDEEESQERYPAAYDGVVGVTALTSEGRRQELPCATRASVLRSRHKRPRQPSSAMATASSPRIRRPRPWRPDTRAPWPPWSPQTIRTSPLRIGPTG